MSTNDSNVPRSVELRRRLDASRARLDASIEVLSRRAEQNKDPVVLMKRHPLLITAAGVALGYVLVRRPRWLLEGVRRVGAAALPVITSTVMASLGSDR